jgi:hypothetical protein
MEAFNLPLPSNDVIRPNTSQYYSIQKMKPTYANEAPHAVQKIAWRYVPEDRKPEIVK